METLERRCTTLKSAESDSLIASNGSWTAASIIICTCDRASYLKETLLSLERLVIPQNMKVELLLVDNGSTDNTADVIHEYRSSKFRVVYLLQLQKGKAHACNTALRRATGDVLLWTDDDVRVPRDWLVRMTAPLLDGSAQAVSGKIRMAGHLERRWMKCTHYFRLADNRFRSKNDLSLVGANMAFSKAVLQKVPQFEAALGPGASGQRDDTFFSRQVLHAGFRVCQCECEVEHFFEESRLLRKAWLRHGEASGKSSAFVRFHWEHGDVRFAAVGQTFWRLCLWLYRVLHPFLTPDQEGCHRLEIRMMEQYWFFASFRGYRKQARKYAPYGLVPLETG
jgi:glycosyltransferase involved in cell wall biosynthesis